MKHLSRVLSLALVIALSLGLVVTAGAVDKYDEFTDVGQIEDEYIEAVDVLTALKVLSGYTDGSLKPKNEVTRAEAAKLVTYISIGTTAGDRLAHRASSFTDVATDHWANPFIEFAVERGIINGIGNGKFNPEGSVTGSQVAKLMLTALGYGAKGEYVGSSWELNSVVDGQKRGILTVDTDYSLPAKREEVIQYVFNTISPINPTSRNYLVKFSNIIDDYVLANSNNTLVAIGNTGSEQFLGEETFGLLAREGNDAYGYAGHNWALYINPNKHITGFYQTDVVLGENKIGVPVSSLTDRYNPMYIAPSGKEVAYYVNGVRIDKAASMSLGTDQELREPYPVGPTGLLTTAVPAGTSYFIAGGGLFRVTDAAGVGMGENPYLASNVQSLIRSGVIVTLVDSGLDRYWDFPEPTQNGTTYRRDFYAFDGSVDAVIIIEKTVHDVAGTPVVAANGDVRIPGVTTTALHADQIDYPAGLVAKDVVLMHTDAFHVTHIEKAESVTGKMTYINRTLATVTVEGGVYGDSGLVGANAPLFEGTTGYAHDGTHLNLLTTLYLDDGGSVVRAIPAEPVVPRTFGFVVAYEASALLRGEDRVVLLDNTNVLRLLTVAPKSTGEPDVTDIDTLLHDERTEYNIVVPVEYIIKEDGKVALTVLPTAVALTANYADRSVTIAAPANSILKADGDKDAVPGNYYITSETAILYADSVAPTKNLTRVLKGYSATKGLAIGGVISGIVTPGTRNLAAIYFGADAPGYSASQYFFLADGRVDVTGQAPNLQYEYDAYVNGEKVRIITKDFNLIGRTEIENQNMGLWAYDGNNSDVKYADQEPGVGSFGIVDVVDTNASGTVITALGLNGAQSSVVCTSTTKYYEVSYFNPLNPFAEVYVSEAVIGQSNAYMMYLVEGVERNNDGSAKAVYFTREYITGGPDAYVQLQINYASAYNVTLNDTSANSIADGAGVASINAQLALADAALNPANNATTIQKLEVANRLRGTVVGYALGLAAAKTAYAQPTNAIKTESTEATTATETKITSEFTINSNAAYLFGGGTGAYAWSGGNTIVTITFADGATVAWTLDNARN
jgi:hypothetical protein